MSSNSFATSLTPSPIPLTVQDKKVISFNNKQDKQHKKIMNESKPMTRRFNVNQWLTNMKKDVPIYFKMLSDAFPNLESIRDEKYFINGYKDDDDETILIKESYIFDKQVQNKTALKIELIKLVIYLIYENYFTTSNELMNIFLIAQHLIKYSFTARFKIISKRSKKSSLTSINKLVCFLLNPEKNSDILFNEDEIIEEPEEEIINPVYTCCCCLEDYQTIKDGREIKINCSCSVKICESCYNNLTIYRCPQCRGTENFKREINDLTEEKRKIKFTSLTKVKTEKEINLKYYCNTDNELLLLWQEGDFIRYGDIKIQSMTEIIKEEYDSLINDLETYIIPSNEILAYLNSEVHSDYNGNLTHGQINYIRDEETNEAGAMLKRILKIKNIHDYKRFRDYRNFEYEKEDNIRRPLFRTYNDDEIEVYYFTMNEDITAFQKIEKYEIDECDSEDEEIEHKIYNLNTNTYGDNLNITRFNSGEEVII